MALFGDGESASFAVPLLNALCGMIPGLMAAVVSLLAFLLERRKYLDEKGKRVEADSKRVAAENELQTLLARVANLLERLIERKTSAVPTTADIIADLDLLEGRVEEPNRGACLTEEGRRVRSMGGSAKQTGYVALNVAKYKLWAGEALPPEEREAAEGALRELPIWAAAAFVEQITGDKLGGYSNQKKDQVVAQARVVLRNGSSQISESEKRKYIAIDRLKAKVQAGQALSAPEVEEFETLIGGLGNAQMNVLYEEIIPAPAAGAGGIAMMRQALLTYSKNPGGPVPPRRGDKPT